MTRTQCVVHCLKSVSVVVLVYTAGRLLYCVPYLFKAREAVWAILTDKHQHDALTLEN